MPGLISTETDPAKILYIGDQGNGKTGSKAALVAMGYKLRMIDTDRGFKILRALLTDAEHYPYASWMKKTGIDPTEPGRISYIPIDVPFDFTNETIKGVSWEVLKPTSSSAWTKVGKLLQSWKDDGQDLGSILDWDSDIVLDFDTMSTLAEMAKYWVQDMNGRLGSLTDDHGRDTGGGQEMIMRLMSKLTNSAVRCNLIVTGHIRRIDMSNDVPQSVEARLRDKKPIEPHGFPAVIGQAVGPYIGKKFNDLFVVKRDGDRSDSERRIYSVPVDNTDTKHSAWVEDSYPLDTGLASIFAALRYQPPPEDFLKHVADFKAARGQRPTDAPAKPTFGSFGR